jgi:sulfur carrier protein
MIMVNNREAEWHEGLTVRGVMEMHNYTSPKVVVKVNGDLVRKEEWDTFVINDGDDVKVIHLIGGG